MYVKADSDELNELHLPGMSEPATFSDNNIAQVSADDGEVLLENENISEHTKED